MTRTLMTLSASFVVAALMCGCDNSSSSSAGGGDPSTPRTDVQAGKYQQPGADLSTATGDNDPTGGKTPKGSDTSKDGG